MQEMDVGMRVGEGTLIPNAVLQPMVLAFISGARAQRVSFTRIIHPASFNAMAKGHSGIRASVDSQMEEKFVDTHHIVLQSRYIFCFL